MILPIATSCALIVLGLIWSKQGLNVVYKIAIFGLGLAGLLSALRVF